MNNFGCWYGSGRTIWVSHHFFFIITSEEVGLTLKLETIRVQVQSEDPRCHQVLYAGRNHFDLIIFHQDQSFDDFLRLLCDFNGKASLEIFVSREQSDSVTILNRFLYCPKTVGIDWLWFGFSNLIKFGFLYQNLVWPIYVLNQLDGIQFAILVLMCLMMSGGVGPSHGDGGGSSSQPKGMKVVVESSVAENYPKENKNFRSIVSLFEWYLWIDNGNPR